MSDGDPNPAPLPGESESTLRTRRLVMWTTLIVAGVGSVALSYLIAGWDAVIGGALTAVLIALSFTVPELVRIRRALRAVREARRRENGGPGA